jgi:hypothetical protein
MAARSKYAERKAREAAEVEAGVAHWRRKEAEVKLTIKRQGRRAGLLSLDQMDSGVHFYHPDDERAYFEWLERIPCVATVFGETGRGLVVRLKRRPSNSDLRSLIAAGLRYGFDLRQLAKFETATNRGWFRDPKKNWHKKVFAPPSTVDSGM